MSRGREHDWEKESYAETAEFLDDLFEYFQEDERRIIDFERWKERRKHEKCDEKHE